MHYVQVHNRTIWVVLRHGSKSLPVRVVNIVMQYGLSEFCSVHQFRNGYKLILSCEWRWVFNTIILDEDDNEVRYDWSKRLNPYWQELHHAQGDK